MRYRPFGGAGAVVSAISLRIPSDSGMAADDCVALVHAALEQGINYIEAPAGDPEVLFGLGEAVAAVERDLMVLSLRLGCEAAGRRDFSAEGLAGQITDALARTGLKRDMTVVGFDPWPAEFRERPSEAGPKGFLGRTFGLRPANPLAGAGTYAFLETTRGWTSEEICLAYALTDVKIATVMVEAHSIEHLERLASVADREMPAGLSAQVEMARFSKESVEAEQRRA